jgi:hypothetical protein
MKAILILATFSVNNGDGVAKGPHYKAGDVVSVSDEAAELWIRAGRAQLASTTEVAGAKAPAAGSTSTTDELEGMKAKDLVALAGAEKIELGRASSKTEIIAAIRLARAETAKASATPPAADPPASTETDPKADPKV